MPSKYVNWAESLEAWSQVISGGYEAPAAGNVMHNAAKVIREMDQEIQDLRTQLEDLRRRWDQMTLNRVGFTFQQTGERVNIFFPDDRTLTLVTKDHPEILYHLYATFTAPSEEVDVSELG